MQQDHRTAAGLVQHALGNFLRVAIGEIFRIDVLPQREISERARARDDLRLRRLVEGLVRMIGRPEEPGLAPGDPFQQALVDVELDLHPKRRDAGQVGMGEGVISDHMPLGELAAHQVGARLGVFADEEERRLRAAGLEHVENLRRPVAVGPVVEGEQHLAAGRPAVALEDPARGILLVVDPRDVSLGVPGHGPLAALRPRLEREKLALTGDGDVVVWHRAQE